MLKNIDFKKMSYDEGLALVAETRKKALQRSRVKQANSMVDAVKKYWDKIPPEAKWSLLGAGTGGLGGLAASLIGKKDDEDGNYGRNILTGALLGGLTGYGGRLGYDALTTPTRETDTFGQNVASGTESLANFMGETSEGVGLVLGGKVLGDKVTSDYIKNNLSGTKITNLAIDPSDARKNLTNYLDKVLATDSTNAPKGARVFDPVQKKNLINLRKWAANAPDDDVIRALSNDGFLSKSMGKGWVSNTLIKGVDLAKRSLPLLRGRPMGPATARDANLSAKARANINSGNVFADIDYNKRLQDTIGLENVNDIGGYMKRLTNVKNPLLKGWKKPNISQIGAVGLPLLNYATRGYDWLSGDNINPVGGQLSDKATTVTNILTGNTQ